MKREETYINDLEYLAQQGFEKIAVTSSDFNQLNKKIKKRISGFTQSFLIALISLIVGAIIGAVLFSNFSSNAISPYTTENKTQPTNFSEKKPKAKMLYLDTITIVQENFIKHSSKHIATSKNENASGIKTDTIIEIPIKELDLATYHQKPLGAEKINFIINSSVFYLHDLKITNYTTLYFKKNQFVPYNGLSADFATKENFDETKSHLKQNADYFLHDEIANAMLYFKKAEYDKCISSLNTISKFNKDDLNCSFYLGMCYYHKKNYSKAIDLLNKCVEHSNNTFLQESIYYKALSQFENGNEKEATIQLNQIIEDDAFYSEKAKGFLENHKEY